MSITIAVISFFLALGGLGLISWRGMQRLKPLDQHLLQLTLLEETELRLEEMMLDDPQRNPALVKTEFESLRRKLDAVLSMNRSMVPGTIRRLERARAALESSDAPPKKSLAGIIRDLRLVVSSETQAHQRLLDQVQHGMLYELEIAGGALAGLTALILVILMLIRRRIVTPLRSIEVLLFNLARRHYVPAQTEGIDPILLPLTTSYNHLVRRLAELERENARYTVALEDRVRLVSGALLEQQRSLANAERLAATGEIAARIAHELRNPLAGMQFALANIRQESSDRSHIVQRLDLVIDEMRRVTGLLNGLLDQTRLTPEPAVELALADTVSDLLSLVRYQVPERVQLLSEISPRLVCRLPRDSLRQILLNLVLNSVDAIGRNDGRVVISAEIAEDGLVLTVTDDGPGFSKELLGGGVRVFQSGRPGGTGLGLAMVLRLVRNMEGRMELSNVEPNGANVKIILPCRGMNGE